MPHAVPLFLRVLPSYVARARANPRPRCVLEDQPCPLHLRSVLRSPFSCVPFSLELADETFRHQKVTLVAQGADPSKVQDPLYQFDRAAQLYRPLTAADYQRLLAGDARL